MIWLSFVLVIVSYFVLFKTPIGLRMRAVGEHPRAADTVGISVYGVRYAARGRLGHARRARRRLPLDRLLGSFNENMTAGRGFIALAALIFGNWRPFGAFGAALLFGFSSALAPRLAASRTRPRCSSRSLPYVADADRRRRRDRPLDPARRRRAALRQAVGAEGTGRRLGRCSAWSRSPRCPSPSCTPSGASTSSDLGRRRRPGAFVLGLGGPCGCARGSTPRGAEAGRAQRLVNGSGRQLLGLLALALAGTGCIALAVYAILSYQGRI